MRNSTRKERETHDKETNKQAHVRAETHKSFLLGQRQRTHAETAILVPDFKDYFVQSRPCYPKRAAESIR